MSTHVTPSQPTCLHPLNHPNAAKPGPKSHNSHHSRIRTPHTALNLVPMSSSPNKRTCAESLPQASSPFLADETRREPEWNHRSVHDSFVFREQRDYVACTEPRRHYFNFRILPIIASSFVFQLVLKKAWQPAFCGCEGYLVASSVAMLAYWVSGLDAVLAMEGLPTKEKREMF